jgi:hypothetical protein
MIRRQRRPRRAAPRSAWAAVVVLVLALGACAKEPDGPSAGPEPAGASGAPAGTTMGGSGMVGAPRPGVAGGAGGPVGPTQGTASGTGASDAGVQTPADAGTGTAGAAADAGSGSAVADCSALAGATSTIVELSPALFGSGDDPSLEPQCRDVLNPERGVFLFRDLRSPGNLGGLRADGYTLIYGKVLIDDYRDRDLDAALLDRLSAGFAAVRSAGLKVLPRVYYADDGESPDAPLARVLAHIGQLTPLLRDNADVIAVLHAGFVGAWGEWHASSNDLTEPSARKQIFDALLAALPPERMTLSRRPSFKQVAYGGPLSADTMFDGSPLARVGHLNDCFLASDNDVGTYQVAGERDYAIADSAFVPVGGETCGVYPARSACAPALAELARLHWSFLNTSYHPDVIAGFRSGGCFDAIACRLGYRFALLRHESPQALAAGAPLALALRVVNDGFARMYNPRPVELVLDGPVRRVLATSADPRTWAPGEPADVCLSSRVPADLPPGAYRLGIRLPDAAASLRDDPSYAVRLANAAEWDATTGTNLLDANVMITP